MSENILVNYQLASYPPRNIKKNSHKIRHSAEFLSLIHILI